MIDDSNGVSIYFPLMALPSTRAARDTLAYQRYATNQLSASCASHAGRHSDRQLGPSPALGTRLAPLPGPQTALDRRQYVYLLLLQL